ncbi:hypothetical protein [Herbaspirillum rubrisubalbicans]|uniref:hypothetical protein n=1 Tax=Herbaspirillum rubrisubalbicans TaxID=80842 RepID=UPI0015C5523F|nr:hypothetical protein [Herbaspirillum rubrisubalbicans]NQE50693.1 hypothetical protein [Herbaspirillum rubrisubalbicans]
MSADKIPLSEETTQATETAMDRSKPQALPHDAVPEQKRPAQGDSQPPANQEHPISVGKP